MNIVYASTRGWNVGDDFIRLGCEKLMEEIFPRHNHLLYDKSPHVRSRSGDVWEKGEFHGNSIGPVKHRGTHVDLCVFAGTPSCSGRITENFFRFGVPVIGLALGASPQAYRGRSRELWKTAQLLTTRSRDFLDGYCELFGNVEYLPCTSLFCADGCREVKSLNRVALGWKSARGVTHNMMPHDRYVDMVNLYRLITKQAGVEFVIVCHHIDELQEARDAFPSLEVRYSYDEHRFEELYSDVDFVISPKVHGVGICASLGIGGVLLPIDSRRGTVDGFLAGCTWSLEVIRDCMERCAEHSRMLRLHRTQTWGKYIDILKDWRARYV